MPAKPLHPCNKIGCNALTRERHCPAHTTEATRYDRDRGSAASRGYGSRWRQYRKAYLAKHPLCATCLKDGRTTAATDLDHIEPIDGPDDVRFWDTSGHQALCGPCHKAKSARERVR